MALTVEMILKLVDQATAPMRGVQDELKRLDAAARGQDLNRGVKASAWYEQQRAIRRNTEELNKYENQLRNVDSMLGNLAGSFAAFAAAHAGMHLLKEEAKAGADAVRNAISMTTAGFKASEISEMQEKAREISSRYKQFDRTQIEDQIIETTPALGSLHHALEFQGLLTQYRAVVEAQDPASATGKGMQAITRALEEFNAATDKSCKLS